MKNIEKIINSIDENNEKLNSLQEYKNKVIREKENMDVFKFNEEIKVLDEEMMNLQEKINKDTKTVKHYNYALDYLIELYELNNILEYNEEVEDRKEVEDEVLEYTKKLEKHLSYLPENLINELQEDYVEYINEVEEQYDKESVSEEIKEDNNEIKEEIKPNNYFIQDELDTKEETVKNNYDFNDFEEDLIFDELLKVFDSEREEFLKTKIYETPEDLLKFIDKYKDLKMHVYCKYAITKNIGIKPVEKEDEVFKIEDLNEKNTQPKRAPIIIMLDLVNKIDIEEKDGKELHPTNIRIGEGFKQELKETDLLYNVVHMAPEIVNINNIDTDEFIESCEMTTENIRRINILVDRINDLSDDNLKRVYEEYYIEQSNRKIQTILEIVLREKYYENK